MSPALAAGLSYRGRADTWLRIIVAIGTLGEPPTDAWHCRR